VKDAIAEVLKCCSNPTVARSDSATLSRRAALVGDWDALVSQAEAHGVGPLVYAHLRAAGVPVPDDAMRQIRGIYLQHRYRNQLHEKVLCDVVTRFATLGLDLLVVKGAALSHLIYPEPGLRPMSDIDILVKASDSDRVEAAVRELGFRTFSPKGPVVKKSLPTALLFLDGVRIGLEIHYDLFEPGYAASFRLEDMRGMPLRFAPGKLGLAAQTLGYEQTLWHLAHHLMFHTTVFDSFRLIWAADIVGFAERFAVDIDWELIRTRYPIVIEILSLLHFAIPLSEPLLERGAIPLGRAPGQVLEDFEGWPRAAMADQWEKGLLGIAEDTLSPPEWWLRLHHGLGSARDVFWYRWIAHPMEILGWVKQLLLERLGLRSPR